MTPLPLDPSSEPPPEGESSKPIQPMQPPHRRKLLAAEARLAPPRGREPIGATISRSTEADQSVAPALYREARPRAAHREVDPIFAYLIILSLAIGISPLDALVRYVILWTLMGGLGTIAYLLGGVERMREAKIDDLLWGVTFGFLSSFPFLVVFGSALETVSRRMFDAEAVSARVMDTWVFMAVAFVLPFCETLFFRGGMQSVRSILLTTILATFWSAVMFFPNMELAGREVIGVILLIVFSLLNFLYSYVKFRNGLAGAWLCQVTSYTLLWFFPRLLF